MTNIEKIKAEMLSISKKTKLPEFYVEDLSKDLSLVETFSGHKLVWVLRTCGSALVPTKVGVHPTHVTHWIWGNSGQQIMTYSVDTLSGVIEKIDFEEAERMIMQPPRQLTLSLGKEAISKQVNQVLAIGCDLKVWRQCIEVFAHAHAPPVAIRIQRPVALGNAAHFRHFR